MTEGQPKRTFIFPPQAWAALAAAALLAMEVTVLSLWYRVFFRSTSAPSSLIYLVLGAVLLGSYLLAHGLERWKRSLPVRQGVFLTWLLLAAFGSLRVLLYANLAVTLPELFGSPLRFILTAGTDGAAFFHLLSAGLLIWHGIALARGPVSLLNAQVSFQLGLIWMLIYGMAFAPSRPVEATIGLYSFLFFGLISMSAARVAGLTDLRGGRLPRFGPNWLGGIALAALAVVGLSILLGWLAGTRVIAFVVRAFMFLLTAITGLLMMVFTPLLFALARMLTRLVELIQQVFARLSSLQLPRFVQDLAEELGKAIEALVPAILAARGLFLAAVLGIVLVVILLALRFRLRHDRLAEEDDTGYSSAEPTPNLLRRMLVRLAEQGRRLRLRTPGQIIAAARVRQIYRQLMALSQKLGVPRPPSITPLEFTPRLDGLFPEHRVELDQITGAYVRVRYGEYPETMGEVEAVQAAWERVRRQGRIAIAQRRKVK